MKQTIIFLALSLSSCSPILKKISGISDPKIESVQSLRTYSEEKLGIDPSRITFAKDSAAQYRINQLFGRSPEILVFSADHTYVPYKDDSVSCNASVDITLQQTCSLQGKNYRCAKKPDYQTLLDQLYDPANCLSNISEIKPDYIVFINYAKFAHGVNKTHIIPWNKVIRENKLSCKVVYVYVDLDYLDRWGMKKSSLPKIKLKAT